MDPIYKIEDTSTIISPALIFYRDLIRKNIAQALRYVGDVRRLRPHVKTHKTREIVRMQLESGITKHKCATIPEAEMIASCGAADVLIAYPLIGPNQPRLAQLIKRYPKTQFASLVDHPDATRSLSQAMARERVRARVLLDLDTGMHRSGIPICEEAIRLYHLVNDLPGLSPAGLHVYDGQNHHADFAERQQAIMKLLEEVRAFKSKLESLGLPVPTVVMGGTPQFGIYSKIQDVECSPGTCFLHDHGYRSKFGELDFTPAALMLTRVISRPTSNRVTLDLGYKALASDPPAGQRCTILDIPDGVMVLQNEEHLVVETPAAAQFRPGDEVYAMPTHICPTCALHKEAVVVENNKVVDRWQIASRDRWLEI